MARKRMIDPDFWEDRRIAQLSHSERLLFLACVSAADDEGRLLAHPALLRAKAFPYDEISIEEVKEMRNHIAEITPGYIVYAIDGEEYIAFARWDRYQWPSNRRPSKKPEPPIESIATSPQQNIAMTATPPQPSIGKVSIGKDSSSIARTVPTTTTENQTEREKTIAAYEYAYVPHLPGKEAPISLYPTDSILDDIEYMADVWGDDVIQEAIRELKRPQLPPKYIEKILKRWRMEGKIEPKITQREAEVLREKRT